MNGCSRLARMPLAAEAANDGVGVHAPLEHLERDAFLDLSLAHREIHRPHPASTQFALESIRTDVPSLDLFGRGDRRPRHLLIVETHIEKYMQAKLAEARRTSFARSDANVARRSAE